MKFHLRSLFTLLLFSHLLSFQSAAQQEVASNAESVDRIEVFDFHTDHRCKTCLKIEKLTKETLENEYSKEMASGLITFQLVNVDNKENFPLAQKFLAFGTTLIINVVQGNQESFQDLTEFAFFSVSNESKFKTGFQERLNKELQKIQ